MMLLGSRPDAPLVATSFPAGLKMLALDATACFPSTLSEFFAYATVTAAADPVRATKSAISAMTIDGDRRYLAF